MITIVDANIILRFILADDAEMTNKATEILCYEVFVPFEVVAEVVSVLKKFIAFLEKL
ncbi:MAG: twitching motility protein PilT [Epsilonproteobacteria bacterium]|nr:twitching motility protein PilT [Campylobacterota bacterium]